MSEYGSSYKFLALPIAVVVAFVSFGAYAHDHHGCDHGDGACNHSHRLAPPPQKPQAISGEIFVEGDHAHADSLKDFIANAHHSLEVPGHHSKDFKARLRSYLFSFDFKRLILAGQRWVNVAGQDERFREHAKNIAFLFGVSQTLETLTGPAMLGIANIADWPTAVETALVTAGFAVSTPGLVEPFCWLVFLSYPIPAFNKAVTKVRVTAVRVSSAAFRGVGAQALLNRYFPLRSQQDLLRARGWDVVAHEDGSLELSVQEGESQMALALSSASEGRYSVDSVSVKGDIGAFNGRVRDLFDSFNWNVRSALKEVLAIDEEDARNLGEAAHVRNVVYAPSETRVEFVPNALLIKPKRKYCGAILDGKTASRVR